LKGKESVRRRSDTPRPSACTRDEDWSRPDYRGSVRRGISASVTQRLRRGMVCGHKWPLFNARSSTSRKRRPAQRSKLGQPHKARAKLVSRRAKKQGRPGGAGTGL